MTKVCTPGRDASLAMQMLEQILRRLQTDHLDLWQIHGISFSSDPELFIRPNGAAEALIKAKKEGKVRFTGFTGHKDPDVHLGMLNTGFPFDAVQMPLNPFDANFQSFEKKVLPVLNRRGIAAIGMKLSVVMESRFRKTSSLQTSYCAMPCLFRMRRPSLASPSYRFWSRT